MVEENPEKEILLDPRWAILEDGLGSNVLTVGGTPKTEKDGREVVVFTIKPDEFVRKRYNYRRGNELDDNGNMKLTVAKNDLIAMNLYDDANKKWLYTKSFRHDETELSNREKTLQLRLKAIEKRALLLEAQNIRLNEQLELAKTNPAKFAKQGMELIESSAKVLGAIIKKDKKDDD